MSAGKSFVEQESTANAGPGAPGNIFTFKDTSYRMGSVIREGKDDTFIAYEVFSIPDQTPYLYRLYKYEDTPQYQSLKTKLIRETEELSELFETKVELVITKQHIEILMPRYSEPFSIGDDESKQYRLDAHSIEQGNRGRVIKVEPLDPQEQPLAMKVYFDPHSQRASPKHSSFIWAKKLEVKNLAPSFDTRLDYFRDRTVLLMPFFPGQPVLTFIGDRWVLHPGLSNCPLSSRFSIAALFVQALIELQFHGDLKPANTLVEIIQGEDGRTYTQVELIDPAEPQDCTLAILAPEAAGWLDHDPDSSEKRQSIQAEMYALSSILATVLTASVDDPAHVFAEKFKESVGILDTMKVFFCFDLMKKVLTEASESEIQKFKEAQAEQKAKPQDGALLKKEFEDEKEESEDEIQLEEMKDVALQQATEEVIQKVEAMGSQNPEKRGELFDVLRVLLNAASLCFELEQAREEMSAQKVEESESKNKLEAASIEVEPDVPQQENKAEKKKEAIIPNRRYLLSQKSEKKQQPKISDEIAEQIAANRIAIREKTEARQAIVTARSKSMTLGSAYISTDFQNLLKKLQKIDSNASSEMITLVNGIKPSHTLEEVIQVVDKIKEAANDGITRATKRKGSCLRFFGFFHKDNSDVYKDIVSKDLELLKDKITAITNNEEYKEIKRLEEEIKALKEANQELLKGGAVLSPVALHGC